MNTLLGVLGIALAWVFYGATLAGLGALFLGLICRATLLSFFCCYWIGLALLVTTQQIVHLFCGIISSSSDRFVFSASCHSGSFGSGSTSPSGRDSNFGTSFLQSSQSSGSQIDLSPFRPCTIRGCTTLIRCRVPASTGTRESPWETTL
jgi:hypothetical protein